MNRLFIIPVFIGVTALSFIQKTDNEVNVSGCVKIINPWCTDVMTRDYEEYIKPKPLPNKILYIKQGEVNDFSNPIYMKFTSDRNGNFSISLPPGKYIIVEERKKDKSTYDSILTRYGKGTKDCRPLDTACFKKWYEKPDVVLNLVHDSIKNITITFHRPCEGACDIPCARNTWYKPR